MPAAGGVGAVIRRLLLGLLGLGIGAWGAAALWIDGPAFRPLAWMLAAGFFAASLVLRSEEHTSELQSR